VSDYLLRARVGFEAAHHLLSYQGSPEEPHGHSWIVEAVVRAVELDNEGMGFDFVVLRRALLDLASRLDHKDLNRLPPFDRDSPTTERVARWFFEELRRGISDADLVEVTIWEGPWCAATYRRDSSSDEGEPMG